MLSYNKIINDLIKKKISLSIAESCTGGQLSKVFTDIPGISNIFNMGLITYSNESKSNILKIDPIKIIKYGAVSEEIAILMCKNLFKISKSNLCISTTGIAGPNGGTKKKPIGLVYISIKFYNEIFIFKKIFKGKRNKIQRETVNFCLEKIKRLI